VLKSAPERDARTNHSLGKRARAVMPASLEVNLGEYGARRTEFVRRDRAHRNAKPALATKDGKG